MSYKVRLFEKLQKIKKLVIEKPFERIQAIRSSIVTKGLSNERDFSRRRHKDLRGNAHLFTQDISQHKMPYSHRLSNYPNFNVTITGADSNRAKLFLENLSKHNHNRSDTDLISDVVNNLSQKIYYWRKIYYCKSDELNGPACIEVWPVEVFKLFSYFVQMNPERIHLQAAPKLRYENAENVFSFSLFESRSDRWGFFLIEWMLNKDRTGFPTFFAKDNYQNKSFDFKKHKSIETVFLATVTKKYAWKLRFLADDLKNEYFRFYTSYLSAIRDAEDRESIIVQLNQMLKQFKLDAVVKLEGIPTSADLKKSLQEMEKGEKTFTEALKEIYLN